jgi:aspartyl-tRNA(Asn)/glutamyl-tRNA(Gln) amidotransferase subunit B
MNTMKTEYETVIGLEIHAQMSTKSKLFCGCDNDSFGKAPNTNVCPICMGFPGMLPVISEEAFKRGIQTALALNCNIPNFSKFDRKNYFYPDLPNGFQISQFEEPVSTIGHVDIEVDKEILKIGITRLHLENDAGKLTHVGGGSLVDYNRSGSPLMEIVTEPDLRSAKQASALAKTIQTILRYVGSSEADMEKGMMRFDASVSTRPKGDPKLYPRAEIKNLNSFRALEAAIGYEVKRQVKLWEEGNPMDGEITVGWVDEKQKTVLLRSKEDAADYRYFPEPDLPPMTIDDKTIEKMKENIPELPLAKRIKFIEKYGISEEEALYFCETPQLAQFFEDVAIESKDAKKAASFVGTVLIGKLKNEGLTLNECKIKSTDMAKLITLINDDVISNNVAKTTVFEAMYTDGETPDAIIERLGLKQVSDSSEIEAMVQEILDQNPQAVEDFKAGKQNAIGFIIGQVMKASKGQANPKIVSKIVQEKLS